MHWLYSYIPASRAGARGWRWLTWALFGNDDGGLFGERDAWGLFLLPEERTLKVALRWWLRNPLHNLFFYVLRWFADPVFVVFEYPPARGFYRRAPTNWIAAGPQFVLTLRPLFVSWRVFGFEGYAGWRREGALGFAFRRA